VSPPHQRDCANHEDHTIERLIIELGCLVSQFPGMAQHDVEYEETCEYSLAPYLARRSPTSDRRREQYNGRYNGECQRKDERIITLPVIEETISDTGPEPEASRQQNGS
jgi:hypothetical protein